MPVTETVQLADGRAVQQISIERNGLAARIVTLGAAVQDLRLAEHDAPLVLGFRDIADYADNSVCAGAIAGRFANRIGNAQIDIAGHRHQLDANWLGKHTLHGGRDGLQYQNWEVTDLGPAHVTLSCTLADGHMGFPGNLQVNCTYSILPGQLLDVRLTATTDQATVCGLASHCYFNLDDSGSLQHHRLSVQADQYLECDDDQIPTGRLLEIAGSDFDVTKPCAVAAGVLDHNFCVSAEVEPLREVAVLSSLASGRQMTILTNQPGLQAYNAPQFGSACKGLMGQPYGDYAGLALEPQNWPNAPKIGHFPNAILQPGETYLNHSQFKFS